MYIINIYKYNIYINIIYIYINKYVYIYNIYIYTYYNILYQWNGHDMHNHSVLPVNVLRLSASTAWTNLAKQPAPYAAKAAMPHSKHPRCWQNSGLMYM